VTWLEAFRNIPKMTAVPADLSLSFALVLIVASFFTSAFTAALGLGGGIAMLAIMGLGMPVATVLPVHGAVQLGSNAGRVVIQRRHVVGSFVTWLAIGTVAGVALGAYVVVDIPDSVSKWGMALFILWTVYRKKPPRPDGDVGGNRFSFILGAGIAAFMSMLVGATSPLVAAQLASRGLVKQPLIATHAACMVVQHGLKIVAFGTLGFAYEQWGPLVVCMILSGIAGTWVGTRKLDDLPEPIFVVSFKIVMTLISLDMIRQTLIHP
jgi:uncharacterized protein